MQVTLKKAAELWRAALAAAKAIEPKSTISVSPYSATAVGSLIDAGVTAFDNSLARSVRLVEVAFEIRKMVGEANARHGVDALLTKVAAIDEIILRYTAATGGALGSMFDSSLVTTDDMNALARQIDKARKDVEDAEARRYGGREEIRVSILSEKLRETIADEVSVLRRRRASFKDELTSLNFTNTILLSEGILSVLRAEKLID